MAVQTGHQLVFEPSWAVIEYELAGSLYTGMKQFWNDIKASGAKDFINPTPEVGSKSYQYSSDILGYFSINKTLKVSSFALLAHVKTGKLRAGHRLSVPCCSRQTNYKQRMNTGLHDALGSRSRQIGYHCITCCWRIGMKAVKPVMAGSAIANSNTAEQRTNAVATRFDPNLGDVKSQDREHDKSSSH